MLDTSVFIGFQIKTYAQIMKKQQQSAKKDEIKVIKLPFFNQGVQYILKVSVPSEVPDYRVKELFNLHFVGKGKDIRYDYDIFSKLKGTYTVEKVDA